MDLSYRVHTGWIYRALSASVVMVMACAWHARRRVQSSLLVMQSIPMMMMDRPQGDLEKTAAVTACSVTDLVPNLVLDMVPDLVPDLIPDDGSSATTLNTVRAYSSKY